MEIPDQPIQQLKTPDLPPKVGEYIESLRKELDVIIPKSTELVSRLSELSSKEIDELTDLNNRSAKILELMKRSRDERREVREGEEDYENYECLKTLEGHKDFVRSVIESADQKHIISGSNDKTIKIWGIPEE